MLFFFLVTDAIDEEDRNVLARKAVERVTFSAEEDNWVMTRENEDREHNPV